MFRQKLVAVAVAIASCISCANGDLQRSLTSSGAPSQLDFDLKQLNGTVTYGGVTVTFKQGAVAVIGTNVPGVDPPGTPIPVTPATLKVTQPSWGIYANPAINSAFTTNAEYVAWDAGWAQAQARAIAAGSKHCFLMVAWSDINPSVGVYQGESIIQRFVNNCPDKPVWINIAPFGTAGVRTVPSQLAAVAWDHASMAAEYNAMLVHFAPYFKKQLWLLGVGNEIDLYLDTHPTEIAAYATFLTTTKTNARVQFGSNPFMLTASFTFTGAVARLGTTFSAVRSALDAVSYTYYFFGTGCMSGCATDALTQFLAAAVAADKPYVYQELGFSSAPSLGGTESAQNVATIFTTGVLTALVNAGYPLLGATWFTLNDWDPAILAQLGFTTPLKEFFASTGFRASATDPKESWPTLVGYFGGVTGDIPVPPTCTFVLTPTAAPLFGAGAGSGSLTITTQAACGWTLNAVTGSVPAYFVPSAATGTGTTTITYTVTANTGTQGRSFTLLVGNAQWAFTQEGTTLPPPPPPPCPFVLSATSATKTASAGSGTVDLTTDTGCNWQAQELDGGYDWISIAATNGTASATLTYTVLANTGTANRTARFAIGNATTIFTVTQSGVEAPPPPPPDPTAVLCTSTTNSPTGVNPQIGFTPCRQDVWNKAYSDYVANLANPQGLQTEGGKWIKFIVDNANCNCRYYDFGQFDGFLYYITGDTTWAGKAWAKIDARIDVEQAAGLPDPLNQCREDCIRWVKWLNILKPALTAAQIAKFRDHIADRLELVITDRVGDSDQTIGTYFGVVAFYLTNTDYARAVTLYNNASVGGLTPTITNNTFRTDLTYAQGGTMRNAIYHYFARLARDGGWPESTYYNLGTLGLIAEGYDSIRTITNVEYFPEIASWLPKQVYDLIAMVTPDLESRMSWGDFGYDGGTREQRRLEARGHWFSVSMSIAGLLRGTTAGRQLHDMMRDVKDKYGIFEVGNAQTAVFGAPWMYYNPEEPRLSWRTAQFFYAPEVGIVSSNSDATISATDSQFYVHLGGPKVNATDGKSSYVDHWGEWLGNWQLYRNGRFAVTHPMQYQGVANYREGSNSPLMWGMGGVNAFHGAHHAVQNSSFTYATATTGGSSVSYHGDIDSARNVAVNYWERGIVYLPKPTANGIDTVIIGDAANVAAVVPGLTSYALAGYPQPYGPSRETFTRVPSPTMFNLNTETLPVLTSNRFDWTARNGDAIRATVSFPTAFTSAIYSVANLVNPAHAQFDPQWATGEPNFDPKFLFNYWPTSYTQFGTFLTTVQVGGNGTIVSKEDAGKCRGVHLTRTGESDALVMFNAANGGVLNPVTSYSTTHPAQLAAIAFNNVGCSTSWTAVATSTLAIFAKLNPGLSWTANLDGGGAVALTICANGAQLDCLDSGGLYRRTVANVGAHTLVLTPTGGSTPPVDPPSCPTISILPATLTNGTAGTLYSQAVTASGGTGPYTYIVSSGALPPGNTFSTAGALGGTPTTPGTYNFTVRATDANSCFADLAYTFVIDAPAVTGIARSGTPATFANGSGSATTITGTVTIPAGSNRLGVAHVLGSTGDGLTGCTVGGAAMTVAKKVRAPSDLYVYTLYRVAPSTGAQTLTCTFSSATAIGLLYHGYVGVDPTNPIAAAISGGGALATTSVATTAPSIKATVSIAPANTWTVLFTRAYYPATAGLGSVANVSIPGFGLAVFDSGAALTTSGDKSMEAAFSGTGPVGATMIALNPAP